MMCSDAACFIRQRLDQILCGLAPDAPLSQSRSALIQLEKQFIPLLSQPQFDAYEAFQQALHTLLWDEAYFFWCLGVSHTARRPEQGQNTQQFPAAFADVLHTAYFEDVHRKAQTCLETYAPVFSEQPAALFTAVYRAILASYHTCWRHCFMDGAAWTAALFHHCHFPHATID